MKKTVALCLVLMMLLAGCGGPSGGASSGSAPAELTRYLKGVSYVIPGSWRTSEMYDGYAHYAGDGSFLYAAAYDYAPARLDSEEAAMQAIDSQAKWMPDLMDGYRPESEEAGTFRDHYCKEYVFTYTAWDDTDAGESEATGMGGNALIFVQSDVVYTFLFTGQLNEDTLVDQAKSAILDSIE